MILSLRLDEMRNQIWILNLELEMYTFFFFITSSNEIPDDVSWHFHELLSTTTTRDIHSISTIMQIVCKRQNLLIANGEFFNFLVCIYILHQKIPLTNWYYSIYILIFFLPFSSLVDAIAPSRCCMMCSGIESRIIMPCDARRRGLSKFKLGWFINEDYINVNKICFTFFYDYLILI